MIIRTTPEEAKKVDANINGRIMHSGKKAESILLTLEPGENIPAHKNPFDVLMIGLAGEATIESGGKTWELHPFQTLYITSEENRSLQNNTSSTLSVMVVKLF